jgi:predicted phosphodiesterase
MRVALLSDIHSNLEALEAVIEDARKNSVTHFVILGDTVGYGPNPEECIKTVRNLNPRFVVMGNHDLSVAGVSMDMNREAMSSVEWTKGNISNDAKNWLTHLPFTARRGECIFVHSTLVRPQTFMYFLFDMKRFHFIEQEKIGKKACFLGHSHRPEIVYWKNGCVASRPLSNCDIHAFNMDGEKYATVNVGSVGQPRDNQWMATYVISEMHNWKPLSVELRQVEYDVDKTVQKIYKTSLPRYNAERLIRYKAGGNAGVF